VLMLLPLPILKRNQNKMSKNDKTVFIRSDPSNPVGFFGACGFFEVLGQIDPSIQARWVTNEATQGLEFLTEMWAYKEAAAVLKRLEVERIDFRVQDDKTESFILRDRQIEWSLQVDWWLNSDGEKNEYKLFGGNMKARVICEKLLREAKLLDDQAPENLFDSDVLIQGNFGLDARTGWDALSVGFSPNELKGSSSKMLSYPHCELCAVIGLQTFCLPFGTYRTWNVALPLPIGRIAASLDIPGVSGDCYRYEKRKRGQGYFTLSWSRRLRSTNGGETVQ
jgi:hypothetical protein